MHTLWTIGHSTLPAAEFVALLCHHEVEAVADVRRFPASRHYPQYNAANLRAALAATGIDCLWIPSLGGRRKPRPDSVNTAWRNAGFRGYADYIETEEFAAGLAELLHLSYGARTAVMCAEAVWWRCHRALIADVLRSLGIRVLHISGRAAASEHPYTPPARIMDGKLTYVPEQAELFAAAGD
jgi:uncharacterized protein (DUF488 family)